MPEHSKILVVEDEFILAQDIKNRLSTLNYDVVGVSSNGDDAINKAIETLPDLILMDIRLEGDKDGIETADILLKKIDVPVIFLSAYADRDTVKRARLSEPMGYLIKPCEEKELETTIEMALYKHQVTRKLRENEQWLATTLNNVGDAVIRTDNERRILLLNPVASLLTGWQEEEAIGQKLDDVLKIIDEESKEEIPDPVYSKPGQNQPAITEPRFMVRSKKGKDTPVDFSSTPIQDEKDNTTGVVIVIHDITERRNSEQIIERRLRLEKSLDEVARLLLKDKSPNLTEILQIIGGALYADRGFIFEFREDHHKVDNTHEWCSSKLSPLIDSLQDIDVSPFAWCRTRLKRGESIIIDDIDNTPGLNGQEKDRLKFYQARSLQAVPINHEGTLIGFIGFSTTHAAPGWSEQDLQILRVAGEMISTYKARKKAEEDLRKSELRFRSLIRNSTDLISVIDRKGNFLYQSPSVERILGYQDEYLKGKSVYDFIHPADVDKVKKTTRKNFQDQDEFLNLEFRIRHKKGSYRDMEATGKNMLYDSLIDGIVINSRDVTRRKKAEQDLIKAKNKAEEMNRLKTTFLANMSHEIRTPLTGILGYASIMQTDLENEGDREMSRRIHDSGKRLLSTIDAILDLAKIEADKVDVKLKPLNLSTELRHSVEMLIPIAVERDLTLELQLKDELQSLLDRQLLGQIMNNLIGNALKYTHEGGVKVITERIQKEGKDLAAIHVNDTGVGISKNFLPKIFDEFEQESVGLSRKFEGSGLGLTITKKLVDVMNGEIHVQSEKGKGSTFTVEFPLLDKTIKSIEPEENEVYFPEQNHVTAKKPRLLLVEDNEDSKIVTKNYLNGNYVIDTVSSGEDALESISKARYDAILMDINLGDGMDGVEALNHIRRNEEYKKTPVLALTAYAMKGDDVYYLSQGFNDYLSKPFKKADITDIISKLLESNNSH